MIIVMVMVVVMVMFFYMIMVIVMAVVIVFVVAVIVVVVMVVVIVMVVMAIVIVVMVMEYSYGYCYGYGFCYDHGYCYGCHYGYCYYVAKIFHQHPDFKECVVPNAGSDNELNFLVFFVRQEVPQLVIDDNLSARAVRCATYKTVISRLRVEDATHKGESIYPAEDQGYPAGDDFGEDQETSSDEEAQAYVRLESGY